MTTDSFSLYEIARILKLPADEVVRLDNVTRAKRGKKPKRTRPSAAKVRLYRQRQRLGQIVLKVVVPKREIATFLIESKRLEAQRDAVFGRMAEEYRRLRAPKNGERK